MVFTIYPKHLTGPYVNEDNDRLGKPLCSHDQIDSSTRNIQLKPRVWRIRKTDPLYYVGSRYLWKGCDIHFTVVIMSYNGGAILLANQSPRSILGNFILKMVTD